MNRSALVREIVASELERLFDVEWDDEPVGELDFDTEALVQALNDLDAETGRAFDAKLHPRYPKGHPKAGKFMAVVDQIKDAIKNHEPGGEHPLKTFNRDQLMRAAKARGIKLKRGEEWESIADKLLADHGFKNAFAVSAKAPVVAKAKAKPAKPRLPAGVKLEEAPAWGDHAKVVNFKGEKVGLVVAAHGGVNEEWLAFALGDGWDVDRGPHKNREDAIQALVAAAVEDAKRRPDRHEGVSLAALDLLDGADLRKVAHEHGVLFDLRPRAKVIADLRKKIEEERKEKAEFLELHAQAVAKIAAEEAEYDALPGEPDLFHRDLSQVQDLHRLVQSGQVIKEDRLAGGMIGDTRVRRYKDGTKLVWKKSATVQESDAEQLSSTVARALGLNAPRVYRDKAREVNMEFVDGKVAYGGSIVGNEADGAPAEAINSTEGRMMGLLDQLIANTDRHNGNWMIDKNYRFIPIDHGFAFGGRGATYAPRNGQTPSVLRSPFGEYYTYGGGTRWAYNDLTKEDVAEIRQRLMALKPDFDHRNRGDWHKFMVDRLDAIGKYATGTQSRLLPSLVE